MAKVSVIIVNLNTRDLLLKCLENLTGSYADLELIVADNSSSDGSVEAVRSHFPQVKVLCLENNGLASSMNDATKESTGDYVLYLGSDTYPEKNVISGLVGYFDTHTDVGVATAKLVLENGDIDKDSHRGLPTPWNSFYHFTGIEKLFPHSRLFSGYFLGYQDIATEHEIGTCISHFMFVRKSAYDQIGGWDAEHFTLYGEDIDFCYRMKLAGYKVMYLPQFTVKHLKGATIQIRKTAQGLASPVESIKLAGKTYTKKQFKERIQQMSVEAMEAFYRKHYFKKYPAVISWLVIFTIRKMALFRQTIQRLKDL